MLPLEVNVFAGEIGQPSSGMTGGYTTSKDVVISHMEAVLIAVAGGDRTLRTSSAIATNIGFSPQSMDSSPMGRALVEESN